MSSLKFLLLILPLLSAVDSTPPHQLTNGGDSPTVYELLQSYDFPTGLLPKGITSYELDSATGKFTVNLNKTCGFTIDGYELSYKTKISGTISKDKIVNLQGIQVKVVLFWVNIVVVTKDGDELELSVGIASADFPVNNFYESPQCGCGFDCVNWGKKSGMFNFKRFVKSFFGCMIN